MSVPKKIKILHIVDSLNNSGKTSLLYNFTENLNDSFENKILTIKWGGAKREKFEKNDVEVIVGGITKFNKRIIFILNIIRKIREYKPNVCLCWSGEANILCSIFKFFKVPIIWSLHNTVVEWKGLKNKFAVKLSAIMSYYFPKKIICCSKTTKDVYRNVHKYCGGKLVSIDNGVRTDFFKPNKYVREKTRENLEISKDSILVAVPTRISKNKNARGEYKDIFTLLEAVKIVKEKTDNINFIVFGSNANYENAYLANFIRRNKLDDRVKLLGFRNDVNSLFTSSDIVAICSMSGEGLPIALIEGMACGAIPVCTDSGESRHVINSIGITTPQKQPGRFAEAIIDIASQPIEQRNKLKNLARQKILKNYNIIDTMVQYKKIIIKTV